MLYKCDMYTVPLHSIKIKVIRKTHYNTFRIRTVLFQHFKWEIFGMGKSYTKKWWVRERNSFCDWNLGRHHNPASWYPPPCEVFLEPPMLHGAVWSTITQNIFLCVKSNLHVTMQKINISTNSVDIAFPLPENQKERRPMISSLILLEVPDNDSFSRNLRGK